MMESKLAVPNAILFIFDPSNKETIVPPYDPQRVFASTSSCVSVATLADVDGEVTVRLCQLLNHPQLEGLVQVFDGYVETPGKLLAVVTSQFERVLEIAVPNAVTRITVAVNDSEFPSLISVDAPTT